MVIRKNPMHDTENPPGQAWRPPKYLKDVIKRVYEEEKVVAPAVPKRVTPEMRKAFREAYREGGFWVDRLDYALDCMIEAAPAPAAAGGVPTPSPSEEKRSKARLGALSRLRHAYRMLSGGLVSDQKSLADGLIAPAIKILEENQ